MIDLAFEFGIPAHELAERLPERELVLYMAYAARKMLPSRRQELYMAQMTRAIYQCAGHQEATTKDFLFDPLPDEEQAADIPVPTAEEAREYFGFKPKPKRRE